MKHSPESWPVALTKCFFCGADDRILIARNNLTKTRNDINRAHGACIDLDPCTTCRDWMRQGIILIGIDPARSDPDWNRFPLPNPYRTGGFAVVREEAVVRIIKEGPARDFALRHRWTFIEEAAARALGLWGAAAQDTSAQDTTDNTDNHEMS
jgi:hypothetical protein